MYLSDRDLRSLLPELQFETEDPTVPFVAEEQIQPCSIDLRLGSTFWRQRSKKAIDLRRAKLLEVSPRRHWRKAAVSPGESITLKPGEMILGRTFEAFTIPRSHAGKLEGRSSFARMGLAVHCCADFINPGYRGRMPLQLINFSRSPIRVFPLIPICQLMLIQLSSPAERPYGARELSSKYMDDDGGPSYWWRDKRIKQLQVAMRQHDVVERVQNEILELIGPEDPELIERFERMVQRLRAERFTNVWDLLERFAKAEDRVRTWTRLCRGVLIGAGPVLVAASIGSLFSQPFGWQTYGWLHYALWSISVVSIPMSITAWCWDIGEYFGSNELARVRTATERRERGE